jgi:hypothetical protein
LESLGVINERMLIVHSGWLEPEEVAILAKRKPRWSVRRVRACTTATAISCSASCQS